jgi:hypothetical protein
VTFLSDNFLFNSTIGLFKLGSKSQLVEFFANSFHMIDLSFVSITVFESTTSEFV